MPSLQVQPQLGMPWHEKEKKNTSRIATLRPLDLARLTASEE